jgi:hypothetical protein
MLYNPFRVGQDVDLSQGCASLTLGFVIYPRWGMDLGFDIYSRWERNEEEQGPKKADLGLCWVRKSINARLSIHLVRVRLLHHGGGLFEKSLAFEFVLISPNLPFHQSFEQEELLPRFFGTA